MAATSANKLIADGHFQVLQMLSAHAQQHSQGLSQATRAHRQVLPRWLAKRLRSLDIAYGVVRHISACSVSSMVHELQLSLDLDLRQGVASDSSTYDVGTTDLSNGDSGEEAVPQPITDITEKDTVEYYQAPLSHAVVQTDTIDLALHVDPLPVRALPDLGVAGYEFVLMQCITNISDCHRRVSPLLLTPSLPPCAAAPVAPGYLIAPPCAASRSLPPFVDFDYEAHVASLQHLATRAYHDVLRLRFAAGESDTWATFGAQDINHVDDAALDSGASCVIDPPSASLDAKCASALAADHIDFVDHLITFADNGAGLSSCMARDAVLDRAFVLRLRPSPLLDWFDAALRDVAYIGVLDIVDNLNSQDFG